MLPLPDYVTYLLLNFHMHRCAHFMQIRKPLLYEKYNPADIQLIRYRKSWDLHVSQKDIIEVLSNIIHCLQYLTNAALAGTSVASITVLSSTSGLFTLIIGALLGQDSINTMKVVSVIISIAGVAMTTLGKTWAADESKSVSNKYCFPPPH